MKLCSKCNNSPLPFIMVFMIASVSAFMTWLTLGLSIAEVAPRAGASALAFVVIGGSMLMYILNCLKRHCRHQGDHGLDDPQHGVGAAPRDGHRVTCKTLGAAT